MSPKKLKQGFQNKTATNDAPVDEDALSTLKAMGIDESTARWGLNQTNNEVERAIDYIFAHRVGGGPGAGAAAAAPASKAPSKKAPAVSTLAPMPFEVLQYTMTYLPCKDIAKMERVNKSLYDIGDHDDLWYLLLERDFRSSMKGAISHHKGRRLKDVYEMVKTGKYVEKRFEDRPFGQKILIVLGSVVLSPILLIYLTPRICRGIYWNAVAPTMATWTWSSTSPSAAPPKKAALTWADTARQNKVQSLAKSKAGGKPTQEELLVPFFQRPWWQKIVIVILSIVFSPYLLWHYRKAIFWGVVRVITRTIQFVFDWTVKPVFNVTVAILKYISQVIVDLLSWFSKHVVGPSLEFCAKCFRWIWEQIITPLYHTCCKVGLQVLGVAAKVEDRIVKVGECIIDVGVKGVVASLKASYHSYKLMRRHGFAPFYNKFLVPLASGVRHGGIKTGQAIKSGAEWTWKKIVVPTAKSVWNGICWVRDTVITPTCQAIKQGVRWTWNHTAVPVYRGVTFVITKIYNAIYWTIEKIYRGIAWTLERLRRAFVAIARFFYDNMIAPVGRGIRFTTFFIVQKILIPIVRGIIRTVQVTGKFLHDVIIFPLVKLSKAVMKFILFSADLLYCRLIVPLGNAIKWISLTGAYVLYKFVLKPIKELIAAIGQLLHMMWKDVLIPTLKACADGVKAVGRLVSALLSMLATGVSDLFRAIAELFVAIGKKLGGK